MATPWGPTCLFIGLNIFKICNGFPLGQLISGNEGPNGVITIIAVTVMITICLISILLACVCCKSRSGFKETETKVFHNSSQSARTVNETSLTNDPGHVNPISFSGLGIFTPLFPSHYNNNLFRPQQSVCFSENETAASDLLKSPINSQIDGLDVSYWFDGTETDFPRSKLKYIRELGTGWFGRVVEGEAYQISSDLNLQWTPVVVRILESSASAHEQALFLHEATIYRGRHPNIVQLLGRSLEAAPLLIIQELCPKGDLKKFLIENNECRNSDIMKNVPLQFCCQLASALQFLHHKNLPHLDLAARTCQVAFDLNLKLGDYGLAVNQYPNDYYQGTPSIPVRWCAPESINHTNTTLQPKKITCEANIWTLAVTFWEICEWGRLPYDWLSDDEVISQVMDSPHTRLPQPTLDTYFMQPLYRIMEFCWLPEQNRPKISQINSMLNHLIKVNESISETQQESSDFSLEDFDLRWESFKPNTILRTDNERTKSASLTNLHGSLENLTNETAIQMDSWLENIASHTGDMQYVKGLSEAIHELDSTLAEQTTSSSSSFEPTPNSSLCPARSENFLHLDDSSLVLYPKRSESGSETEDETWRKRIERGAYSEKVKQKSKSVADLMVLTHIDMNTVRDIFQEELKKLQEERRESLLFVPVQANHPNQNNSDDSEIKSTNETSNSLIETVDQQLIKISIKDESSTDESDNKSSINIDIEKEINDNNVSINESLNNNNLKSKDETTNILETIDPEEIKISFDDLLFNDNENLELKEDNQSDKISEATRYEEINNDITLINNEQLLKTEEKKSILPLVQNFIDNERRFDASNYLPQLTSISQNMETKQDLIENMDNKNVIEKTNEIDSFTDIILENIKINSISTQDKINIDVTTEKETIFDSSLNDDETLEAIKSVSESFVENNILTAIKIIEENYLDKNEEIENNNRSLKENLSDNIRNLQEKEIKSEENSTATISSEDFSLIQEFINNERNNNIDNIETEKPKNDLLKETETLNPELQPNFQQINKVFNVFNVTVKHNPQLQYLIPSLNQNNFINEINGLLESENEKYESNKSVCTTSLPNDYLPRVNGINSKLLVNCKEEKLENAKFIPKNLVDIALNCIEKNLINIDGLEYLSQNVNNSTKYLKLRSKINDMDSPIKLKHENEIHLVNEPKKLSDLALENLSKNFFPEEIDQESKVVKSQNKTFTKFEESLSEENILIDELPNKTFTTKETNVEDLENQNLDLPVTSTPFKSKTNEENFVSYVSEGDEPMDKYSHVILGHCEDYTLGLYSGLKTTFDKFAENDTPEEELLQFSSNFLPLNQNETVDYSLETWDKFLGKSLQDQENCAFDNFSLKQDNLDVFNTKTEDTIKDNLNETVVLTKNMNDTFIVENTDSTEDLQINAKETENTNKDCWEPGEGWFLHPQTSASEELTGEIDTSGSETIDNSYVGFALDEECMNALRNELAAKLPHAQGMPLEEPQELEDELNSENHNEVIVKYNVYATPLSPIPEESCCEDVFCDQIQHKGESDSESDWSEPCLGQTSQLDEDILIVDTETHTALILESPSLREPPNRHTPSQDSCCSNDTLFNLEDLNCGHSPQHQSSTAAQEDEEENLTFVVDLEATPKPSPTLIADNFDDDNNSIEMNLTYTKPEINVSESSKSLKLNLDATNCSVAPLPSPEDIPWRQLPASLLTYEEVAQNEKFDENANDDFSDSIQDCTQDTDVYSNLTDIRFSGPCDNQLMSTSFSESVDYADEKDWDSGSDTRSSSSGEFIWKEGEHEESLRASLDLGVTDDIHPMDVIDEENSSSSDDSDDGDDIEETEFIPSAWDAQATPTKSALRSPEKSKRNNPQKAVWFKKQKYHCVYEYPREPESPISATDLWRPLSDFSNFTDWELDPESCLQTCYDDTAELRYNLDKLLPRSSTTTTKPHDLYRLNAFPDFTGVSATEEDFYISSTTRPFQNQSSQFFPGQGYPKAKFLWQDYQSSSQQSSRDLSEGITPDSGIDDATPENKLLDILPLRNEVPSLKCLASVVVNKASSSTESKNLDSSLGGLRHTRNRLKLDLPPSPNSFTSTKTFALETTTSDPVVNRDVPTFSTFGKTRFSVQHVPTPTDDSDPLQNGKPKYKNVCFEALPYKPIKINRTTIFVRDTSILEAENKSKPVEMVQGEASLLDSADEDSGIESSANATLERQQQEQQQQQQQQQQQILN